MKKLYYYNCDGKILFSEDKFSCFKEIDEESAKKFQGRIYSILKSNPQSSKRSYIISEPSMLFLNKEGINFLLKEDCNEKYPLWILDKIKKREITALNISYPNYKDVFYEKPLKKWKINISGLGDVGGILASGLRLLGGENISQIGLFDIDEKKLKRWYLELSQILPPYEGSYPSIVCLDKDEIFNCDMFVFCVSKGVPSPDNTNIDVRMEQFKNNKVIIEQYGVMARNHGFKGIFSVVSDPVDLLCKAVFDSSNKKDNKYDYLGIASDRILGFGLGVMNARAVFYSLQDNICDYLSEGRVFGPHGNDIIAANSINNYDDKKSVLLTEKIKNANIKVRETGYKPFIAPALSSGSLSILSFIKGEWHYSSTFMGGTFMGCKNRFYDMCLETERLYLPENLYNRIKNSYERLGEIYE